MATTATFYDPPDYWHDYWGEFAYSQLAYQFPQIDVQPVVRVPIAGPVPFNTLAVVRAIAPVGPGGWASGELRRMTFDVPTPLKLRGYRPERPEQQTVEHSSSATIRMMQITEGDAPHIGDWNINWVYAIDKVHTRSKIADDGRWIVTLDTANSVDQRFAVAICEITSWVMFWEGE